jgi:hypothetical protein
VSLGTKGSAGATEERGWQPRRTRTRWRQEVARMTAEFMMPAWAARGFEASGSRRSGPEKRLAVS